MAGRQNEALPPILEHDARFRAHKPAAVRVEKRIDEADGVALLVDDGDVDGVLVLGAGERRQILDRMRQIDLRRQFVGQAIGQEIVDRNLGMRRIAHECVARCISEARRFDLEVKVVDVERIRLRLEARQDVQDCQSDDSLPVRRAFVDRPSTKFRRDRLHVLALCAREIIRRMQSAHALEIDDHVLGDRPAIEGGGPFAANRFQRVGKLRLTLDRAYARRFAVDQKGASRCRIAAKDVALLANVMRDAWRDRISVARQDRSQAPAPL